MLRSAGFSLPAFARTSVAGDETREVASAAPVPFHRKPLAGVREAIEACGATLFYLPPYSPDLNPRAQSHTPRNRCVRFVAGVAVGSRSGRIEARTGLRMMPTFP